ncbi:hypothetical protein Efla_000916 [Eimeria flavescens]
MAAIRVLAAAGLLASVLLLVRLESAAAAEEQQRVLTVGAVGQPQPAVHAASEEEEEHVADGPLPANLRGVFEQDDEEGPMPATETETEGAPPGVQSSQRGSGEKYSRLLSKGSDFQDLPETHPARVHAESRAARRRSFQLLFAGLVLATAYLATYFYHTRGAGVGSHLDRHTAALNRLSSPASALVWVMAWRLWLGFVVSALVSLLLDAHRLEAAVRRKRRIIPRWFAEHWEFIVGVPLLLLLLLSGKASQPVALESSAAAAGARGIVAGRRPGSLPPRKRLARRSNSSAETEDSGSARVSSYRPSQTEAEAHSEPADSKTNGSKKKHRKDRTRRRRSQSWRRKHAREDVAGTEADESFKNKRSGSFRAEKAKQPDFPSHVSSSGGSFTNSFRGGKGAVPPSSAPLEEAGED